MRYFHPRRIYNRIRQGLSNFVIYWLIPDKWYLTWKFKKVFGYSIDWNNPKSFNEKINWLKLHDRNPKYHLLIDKLRVKPLVADIIGAEHIIPTIAGGFTHISEIDKEMLPDQFVIKCNHDSASVIICKDKTTFDWAYAEYKLNWCMAHDYYHYENKQWAYKGIDKCFFVEEYLDDEKAQGLIDYKFFCFDGMAKCVLVNTGEKDTALCTDMFDMQWDKLPIIRGHPNAIYPPSKPSNFAKMTELAETIAKWINNPFSRIDLYNVDGRIYFGEITFYPAGGMTPFNPSTWDYTLGSWMDLSSLK